MPPKKRPYKPKVKGCYECSQRRVDCDRAEPHCKKCTSRGLKCSGLGIRHRFTTGIATRGKWVGKTVQHVYGVGAVSCQGPRIDSPEKETDVGSPRDDDPTSPEDTSSSDDSSSTHDSLVLQPSLEKVSAWKRLLFHHFSEHIAGEMVAIDGPHNGWRSLVLSAAQADELVMRAVLAVSAFHFSLTYDQRKDYDEVTLLYDTSFGRQQLPCPCPQQLYTAAIEGLQQRQHLKSYDRSAQQGVLLAIVVLLVGVMVTGSSDFPTVFRALQLAIDAINGESEIGKGELADFLRREIRRLRAYAAPLLSEQAGLEMLSSQAWSAQVFACLNYCFDQEPQHAVAVSYITELVYQAHDIYLHHALHSGLLVGESPTTTSDSVRRVQRFKELIELFPHDSPGEQVLVWASFIAASDCVLDEHKTFFENLFQRHYQRSGFMNLLKGLQLLRQIWARGAQHKWTTLVPQARLFIM